VFTLDGATIGVVRVPWSHSVPHFLTTGEVFEPRDDQ
jgi:hypothetical protein